MPVHMRKVLETAGLVFEFFVFRSLKGSTHSIERKRAENEINKIETKDLEIVLFLLLI